MKVLHPGCGCPTIFVAKMIAISDLIFGLVGIFWFIYILDGYDLLLKEPSPSSSTPFIVSFADDNPLPSPHGQVENVANINIKKMGMEHPHRNKTIPMISVSPQGIIINARDWTIFLSGFYTLVNLTAFVILLRGSETRCLTLLKIWFYVRLSIFIFKCFLYVIYIIVGAQLYEHAPHIFFMCVHLYGLWVVWVLMREIKGEQFQNENEEISKRRKSQQSNLSDPYAPSSPV